MQCVYCHGEATTEDHVVAEGFFDQAPPGGYIKVPACYSCNNGYSRDEEYLLVVVLGEATVRSATANRVLDRLSAANESGRRRRTGLARALLARIRPVEFHTPAGIYLGTAHASPLDVLRVNRVLTKIVRGLFFKQFGRILPQDARVYVEIKPEPQMLASPVIQSALRQSPVSLGDVFGYRVVVVPENPVCTAWAMAFYETVLAIAITGPGPAAKARVA